MENKDIRFSIDVPREMHIEVKIFCAQNRITMREFFIESLKDRIEKYKLQTP